MENCTKDAKDREKAYNLFAQTINLNEVPLKIPLMSSEGRNASCRTLVLGEIQEDI